MIKIKTNYLFIGLGVIFVAFLVTVHVLADTASTSVTVSNAAPTISSLSLNGGVDITLNENSYIWATTSMTVTDTNGCSTIASVVAKMYLASTTNGGTTCAQDDNNCYDDTYSMSACTATTTGNTCTGGADTAVQYDCGFKIWYIAEGTDATGDWSSSIWSVSATSSDGTDTGTATNTAETIEINGATYLSVTASISYPATSAGANTGASNQTVTITNTGNIAEDTEISGDVMCKTDYSTCSSDAFVPAQQKFDLSDVTYASLTYTLAATTTPATIQTILANPTATTSAVTDITYWGIAIPSGQANGSYTGQNTFSAVSD